MQTRDEPPTEEKKVAIDVDAVWLTENKPTFFLLGSLQEADTNIMDASEDDQLAAAIAASMEGKHGASDEDEMDEEEKYGEEMAQEPIVALAPEPDGTAWSDVRLRLYFVADGMLCFVWMSSWSSWRYSSANPHARRFPLDTALCQDRSARHGVVFCQG